MSGSESVQVFLPFVYICIAVGDTELSIRDGLGSHWLFKPRHILCLPQARIFLYSVRWEVDFGFVDIDEP